MVSRGCEGSQGDTNHDGKGSEPALVEKPEAASRRRREGFSPSVVLRQPHSPIPPLCSPGGPQLSHHHYPAAFPQCSRAPTAYRLSGPSPRGREILSSHPPPRSRIQFPYTPPATPRPRPIAGRLEGQSFLPAEAALFVDNGRENSFLSYKSYLLSLLRDSALAWGWLRDLRGP